MGEAKGKRVLEITSEDTGEHEGNGIADSGAFLWLSEEGNQKGGEGVIFRTRMQRLHVGVG